MGHDTAADILEWNERREAEADRDDRLDAQHAAIRAAAEELLATLPRCDKSEETTSGPGERTWIDCSGVAMWTAGPDQRIYCDEHSHLNAYRPPVDVELPYAAAVRKLRKVLG